MIIYINAKWQHFYCCINNRGSQWCMFAYHFMPETCTEGRAEGVGLGAQPWWWGTVWAQPSALAAMTAPVQQSPQLRLSSRARMQILTSETAGTIWDLAEVKGESILAYRMGDVFGYLCHQVEDCRRVSVDVQQTAQHQRWQKWVTKFYLTLCSLKPQLYEKREAGRVCACWSRNGDSHDGEDCKLVTSDTKRGALSLPADGQLHDNSVPGSMQWPGSSVQWDMSQLCLHNSGALGGSWVRVGVYTKWCISQQGTLEGSESQEYPGLH